MDKKHEGPAGHAGSSTHDVTALMLDVLRNVNREVTTTIELGPKAQAAVDHFGRISADLSVLPESSFRKTSAKPRG